MLNSWLLFLIFCHSSHNLGSYKFVLAAFVIHDCVYGILLVLVALALFAGQTWARVVAVILVILSAVGQLLLIPAQPWWSLILIAIDVLIIYALIVHGRDLREDA